MDRLQSMDGKKVENKAYSQSDLNQIRGSFLSLDDVMEKSGTTEEMITKWSDAGEFPDPTYETPDGKKWFPPYIVVLIGRSLRNGTNPRDEFLQDARKVLEKPGYVYRFGNVEATGTGEEDAGKMWMDFKSGLYGACLRKPEPESIVAKGNLIRTIKELVSHPETGSSQWRQELRDSVNQLDAIEAQFTDFDRARFGGTVSRDLFITSIKKQFEDIFQ